MHRFVKRGRVRDSHTVIYQIIISDSKSYLPCFLKNQYVRLLEYESYFFCQCTIVSTYSDAEFEQGLE